MSEVFRTSRMVEFGDTDMAGIVHFANFFRYMEAAEHAYLRSCGLSVVTEWEGRKVTFPRVSATCDFIKPARFQEVIDITVRVERLGRSSVTYTFEFLRGEDVLARGKITTVLCRVGANHHLESMEIPARMREMLESGSR
jgi:YbgC/YbaW family acyl-CoA thioester hydrolase